MCDYEKRIKNILFVIMLIYIVGFVPSIKSEAASYVASDHNNMTGNASAKVGRYSVKTQGIKLYSRKSNGKLLYSADNGIDSLKFSTYSYSLKTGKTKKIVNYLRPIDGKKQYVLLESMAHEYPGNYLYVYNAKTGKLKKISSKVSSVIISGDRIFYSEVACKKSDPYYAERILRCNLNGTGKKIVSKAFKMNYIFSMNSKYVVFERNGKKYKLTYKNNKITAVK